MTDSDTHVEPALVQRGPWTTVPAQRTVLVVAHTLVYAQRLRQAVELVETDFRVQVVHTVAPHPFGGGVHRWLEDEGIDVVPWEVARRAPFDLALLAGSRGMHQLRAPVVRLPHGGGNIKALRESEGNATGDVEVPSTLTRRYLTHDGQVVPSVLALAHRDDLDVLARSCPEALDRARVVGDPAYDRVLASLPYREKYRAALGLREREELLLLSSTWGAESSFGRFDALLPRLLRELPPRVRVAMLLHPNVYAGHGGLGQVRRALGGALGERIRLVPPEVAWEGLLAATDWTVGDHGSVTAYAALTGRPVLLARFASGGVVAGSVATALTGTAPVLSPLRPLAEQLEYARDTYDAAAHLRVARHLTSEPDRFNRRMRAVLYRRLGLAEPAFAVPMAPAPPPPPMDTWGGRGAGAAA